MTSGASTPHQYSTRWWHVGKARQSEDDNTSNRGDGKKRTLSSDLEFCANFVQSLCHTLMNADETKPLRETLRDCVGFMQPAMSDTKEHRCVCMCGCGCGCGCMCQNFSPLRPNCYVWKNGERRIPPQFFAIQPSDWFLCLLLKFL